MADAFYVTTADPIINADGSTITLASTYKAVVGVGQLPVLGAHFFGHVGKSVRIKLFGRVTTGATPGNIQIGLLYGTGADANGVTVCQSGAVALIASQTNLSFEAVFEVHCRSTGAAGTLMGVGKAIFNPAVIASTAQPLMIPASAPAVSAACDLTSGALVLSPQILRSGSTAETVQIHDFRLQTLS